MDFINCTVKKDEMEQRQWVIVDIKDYIVPSSTTASYCRVREIYLEASGARAMFTDHYNSNGILKEKAAFLCARVGDRVTLHKDIKGAYVIDIIDEKSYNTGMLDSNYSQLNPWIR